MAETIRGINVVIGSDTTGLSKALSDVNKKSKDIQSELKQVEKLLKLDPKNTELVAQKQKLLGDAVASSREKLDRLKAAQEQVNQQFTRGEISEGQYRAFQREVAAAEQQLEGFEKQLKQTGVTAEQMGKSLQAAGGKMTDVGKKLSMTVTTPIVGAGAAAFKFGADLQDAFGATDQIFKSAGESVKQWADNLQNYYGIAESEALTYANTMGAMLQNIGGLSEEEAAKQSQVLVELAGDLTAMFGGTTESAVQALTGALKGNNSMLDNYGMGVNEATIKTKALEMGLISEGEQLDLAGKQAATLALIFEQTADATRQAEREAEGASGSLRGLTTELKNVAGELGQILMPILNLAVTKIKETVEMFGQLPPATQKATLAIAGIAAVTGPAILAIGSIVSVVGSVVGAFPVMAAAITSSIGLIVLAITAAITAGVLLYQNWDTVKEKAAEAGEALTVLKEQALEKLREGIDFIKLKFDEFKQTLLDHKTTIEIVAGVLTGIFAPALIKTGVEAAIAGGKIAADFIANIVKTGTEAAINGAKVTTSFIASMIKSGTEAVIAGAKITASFIVSMAKSSTEAIKTAGIITGQLIVAIAKYAIEGWKTVGAIAAQTVAFGAQKIALAASAIATGVLTAATWGLNAAIAVLTSPITAVVLAIGALVAAGVLLYKNWDVVKAKAGELWGSLTGFVANAINSLKVSISEMIQTGRDFVNGLWQGISESAAQMAENVKNWFKTNVIGVAKSILGIASPSKIMAEIGRNIILGLAEGMSDSEKQAVERVQKIVQAITSTVQSMTGELSNTLNLVKGKLDLEAAALPDTGAEAAKLGIELRKLAAEKENLVQKIDILTAAYDTAKDRLGENNETTKQYAYELQMAQIELEKTEISIEKTNRAIDQQADEQAVERLKSRLSEVKAAFEITGNRLGMTGTQAQQLKNDLESLSQQIDIQRKIVVAATLGYEKMKLEKGGNSEEAENLRLKLLEEQKSLSDLEKQLFDTSSAVRDHAKEFRDLADEIDQVEKKYRDDLAEALEEYQEKIAEVNRQLIEDEKSVTEEYINELQSRADALSNFVGLFNEVAKKDVYGWQLLENLRGQVDAFESWQENIAALAARGVDEGLIGELRDMGPEAGSEIAALNTLTDEQLVEYVSLWQEKNQLAREEAVSQLQQQKTEMEQKLVEIRVEAAKQLEAYRVEWEKKNAEIRKNAETELKAVQDKFNETAQAGTNYGVALVLNFASGMESQFDRLRQAVAQAQSIIGNIDPTVRHSPSLVDRVSTGLREIYNAYRGLAASIQTIDFGLPKLPDLALGQENAVALAAAGSSTTYNNGGNNIYITVQDGEDMMRVLHQYGIKGP